jgi:DNA-binding response OmpR family regulator
MRILIIEDEADIRNFLTRNLEKEGFAVDSAEDGNKGSYFARTNDYDVVLLDNILPGQNGTNVAAEIRKSGKTMPIIMVSVKSEVTHKVESLGLGIDDYVTKPFSFQELLARIKAVLRRPYEIKSGVLKLEDLTIDTDKQTVRRGKVDVYLTRKEFSLLECLAKQNGAVLSRGNIMEQVWNAEGDPFSNTIESHILNLRKKIDRGRKRKLIKTVPGRGYRIDM